MDTTTKIKILLAKNGMTATQLAEKIGMSQSNLSKKMGKGTFSIDELDSIARVFSAKYEGFFFLEDGEKI